MKRQWTALLTALAVALSLLGVSALAADNTDPVPAAVQADTAENERAKQEEQQPSEEDAAEETPDAGDSSQTEEEEAPPEEEYVPDPVGYISFENLERRLRENNLTLLALGGKMRGLEVKD